MLTDCLMVMSVSCTFTQQTIILVFKFIVFIQYTMCSVVLLKDLSLGLCSSIYLLMTSVVLLHIQVIC